MVTPNPHPRSRLTASAFALDGAFLCSREHIRTWQLSGNPGLGTGVTLTTPPHPRSRTSHVRI